MTYHFERFATITRDDVEIEINVQYTATPYVPAIGPTYDCGGQPAEGGEIEITAVFANGVALDPPLTDDEESKIIDYLYESMDDSDFDDEPDWDYGYEMLRDERLTDG